MKKICVAIMLVVGCSSFSNAEDLVSKRKSVARQYVTEVTLFMNSVNRLKNLNEESLQAGNFLDSDFVGSDNPQLTAGMVNTLRDFVIPNISANIEDVANAGRNKQILLQMRK